MQDSQPLKSLWQNRDFLLLWGGQIVSDTGTNISGIAYPLLVLAITNSPAQAGLLASARLLAYVIFVLPAGALLDRLNRKNVMIICDIGRAFILASIFITLFLGDLSVALLYITGFVEVILGTFFNIALVSCMPQVVRKEQLPAAMSKIEIASGIVSLLGPAIGGALYALRTFMPFLIDGVSYIASAISLLFIRTPFQEQRDISARNLWAEIGVGLTWIRHQPLLLFMAIMTAGNVFVGAGSTLIWIIIAQQHHASSTMIGVILSFFGIGGIIGGFIAPFIQKRFSFAQVILFTMWMFALLWLLLITTPGPLGLGLIATANAIIASLYNVVYISYRLALTPDVLQSRVNSVARFIANGCSPPGVALTGVLLQRSGPQVTVLLAALILALLALIASLNPHIRSARPLSEIQTVSSLVEISVPVSSIQQPEQ